MRRDIEKEHMTRKEGGGGKKNVWKSCFLTVTFCKWYGPLSQRFQSALPRVIDGCGWDLFAVIPTVRTLAREGST